MACVRAFQLTAHLGRLIPVVVAGLLLARRFFLLPVIADDAFHGADREYRTFLAADG